MSEANCARADRNLLFGILALQVDFISRDQLVAAMHAWVLDKGKSLGAILRTQGALQQDELTLLDAMVAKHVQKHGDDPEKSLRAVTSAASIQASLRQVADDDLQASLVRVTKTEPDPDVYATVLSEAPPESAGTRFRILRPHARGGLGEVFVARDVELGREVALKEIQARFAHDPDSRTRFVLEAEITGGLEHPGIVPVYGLGTYPDGRPFYAMRFIKGDSLKDALEAYYSPENAAGDAATRRVQLRQLLRRFYDVCNAIDYAHNRGVLHRDLKPGNVMLGKYGETLVVDWGLAKPLGRKEQPPRARSIRDETPLLPKSISMTVDTEMGRAVGTPPFMSPEQATGRLDLLGPASDIYSLGATLYCILTGRPPFIDKELSVLIGKVTRGNFDRPRAVNPEVARPLEAICLKAMAMRPADRYASVAELAADIERWLDDQPVAAWPEPWTVRTRRWVKRHRLLVSSAAAGLFVALLSLAIATVLLTAANERLAQANQAEQQQRRRAEANYGKARKAVDEMLTRVGDKRLAEVPLMEDVRKELLEEALKFYDEFLREQGDDPELRRETGHAYFRAGYIQFMLGRHDRAEPSFRQSLTLRERLRSDHPGDVDTVEDLAAVHYHLGLLQRESGHQEKEAEHSLTEAFDLQKSLAEGHRDKASYRRDLALTLASLGHLYFAKSTLKLDEAEKRYRQALSLWQDLHRDFPDDVGYRQQLAVCHNSLGTILSETGRETEAEKSYRAALALQEPLVADSSRPEYRQELARIYNQLAKLLMAQGQREAEQVYTQALHLQERLAHDYPAIPNYRQALAGYHISLGVFFYQTSQLERAEKSFRKAIELQERLTQALPQVPAYRRDLGTSYNFLGSALLRAGRAPDAEKALQHGLQILEEVVKEYPTLTSFREDLARCHNNHALLLSKTGRKKEAEDAYRTSLEHAQQLADAFPRVSSYRFSVVLGHANLGNLQRQTERAEAAELSYRKALALAEGLVKESPRSTPYRQQLALTCGVLGLLLTDKEPAQAEEFLRRAIAVYTELVQESPTGVVRRRDLVRSYDDLIRFLTKRGRLEEATEVSKQASEYRN